MDLRWEYFRHIYNSFTLYVFALALWSSIFGTSVLEQLAFFWWTCCLGILVILKLRKGNVKSFFPLWIIHKYCLASFSFKSQLLAGPIKSGVQQSGRFRFDTKQFWRKCQVFWLIDLLLLLIYLWEKDIQNIPIFVPFFVKRFQIFKLTCTL